MGPPDRRSAESDVDDTYDQRDDFVGTDDITRIDVIDADIAGFAGGLVVGFVVVADFADIHAVLALGSHLDAGRSAECAADADGHAERGSRRGAQVDTRTPEPVRAIPARCRARLACRDDHP